MGISKISENIQGAQGAVTKIPQKTMGKEDFLNLLITQMRNQDPLNPLDNSEFSAQLAQFSSLEQLFNINENLKSMETGQEFWKQTQALNYLGKTVEAVNNKVLLKENEVAKLDYSLESPASLVSIGIYAQDGKLIRTIETRNREGGRWQESWDGLNSQGVRVPPGLYSFDVVALNAQKKIVPSTTYLQGKATGILMQGSETQVLLGKVSVPATSITRVLADEEIASNPESAKVGSNAYDRP